MKEGRKIKILTKFIFSFLQVYITVITEVITEVITSLPVASIFHHLTNIGWL